MSNFGVYLSIAFEAKWYQFELALISVVPTPDYFVKNVAFVIAPIGFSSALRLWLRLFSNPSSAPKIRTDQARAYIKQKSDQYPRGHTNEMNAQVPNREEKCRH